MCIRDSKSKDLILAIATPTAQAAAQAITDKPILITAVTDPVAAGLVDSMDKPGGNITGTTDLNPVEEQLKLVKLLDGVQVGGTGDVAPGLVHAGGETGCDRVGDGGDQDGLVGDRLRGGLRRRRGDREDQVLGLELVGDQAVSYTH